MSSTIRTTLAALIATATLASAAPVLAGEMNPTVGGAEMSADKSIATNASAAPNLTTLVAAAKAAGLVDTLAEPGRLTVFAPTNAAFDKLPDGTVASLLEPGNKDKLTSILLCHVAKGKLTAETISDTLAEGNGQAKIETLGGCDLMVSAKDGKVMITDPAGDTATVTTADVMQSNGVVHVIDTVMLPKM